MKNGVSTLAHSSHLSTVKPDTLDNRSTQAKLYANIDSETEFTAQTTVGVASRSGESPNG